MPDFWIVMVEQHYAHNVEVLAVVQTKEEADKLTENHRDRHAYGANWGEEYPTV